MRPDERFSSVATGLDREQVAPDLAWLAAVLWGRTPGLTVSLGERSGVNGAERYAVVPNARRPQFLVPLGDPVASSGSLRHYNALRSPKIRVARWLLAQAFARGAWRSLRPDVIEVTKHVGDGEGAQPSLVEHLRDTLGAPAALAAVGIGAAGPNRKPVLQLVSRRGLPVAYVKVGWNEATREMVRREAEALLAWEGRPSGPIGVPRLLYHGTWHDLGLCATSPLPLDVRRHRPSRSIPPSSVRAVAELSGLSSEVLGQSGYWASVRSRIDSTADGRAAAASDVLDRFVRGLERDYGGRTLRFGSWHGDWAPWNLCWSGRRLHAIDWEHSAAQVPLGFDVVYYHFQVAFLLRRRPVPAALGNTRNRSMADLRALGVSEPDVELLARLLMLELFLRAERARTGGAGTNPRFYPEAVRELDDMAQGER